MTQPNPDNLRRQRLRLWVGLAISAALLGALLWQLNLRQVLHYVAQVDPWMAILALALCMSAMAYSGVRWWVLVRICTPETPLAPAIRLAFVSALVGQLLPGIVGVEAIRIAGMVRVTSNVAGSVTSVLVDRVLGVAAILALVLIGLATAPHTFDPALRTAAWWGVAGIVVVIATVMQPTIQRQSLLLVPRFARRWLHPPMLRLLQSLRAYRRRPGQLALSAALAVGAQLIRVLIVGVCARSLRLEFSPLHLLVVAPVIMFVEMLPISFAGLGVSQASYVYLFGLIGIGAEAAFAVSMVQLAVGTLALAPGVWMLGALPSSPRTVTKPQPAGS